MTMVNYKVSSYIRLSRDESYSNSDSIDNQIKMTDFFCEENKLEVINKYIDNGYSGTTFDRPAFYFNFIVQKLTMQASKKYPILN